MTDREERQHVIKVLKNMLDWMEAANKINSTPERIEAVKYAIASIETDLKYDLLYEETSGQADKSTTKNDLGVDAISRAQTQTEIEMNASRYTIAKERGGMGQVEWSDQLIKVSDAVDIIRNLSSVTPQEPRKGHWIPTYGNVECSVCGHTEEARGVGKATHYCSFCGAKMVEVEE